MRARVDDVKRIQFQILHSNAHAGRYMGGVGALEFHTHALVAFEQQQVQLGTLVGGPEVGLVGRYAKSALTHPPN